MRAHYPGTCSKCHKPFAAGSAIVRAGRNMYQHQACPSTVVTQIAGLDDGTELGRTAAREAALAVLAHESAANILGGELTLALAEVIQLAHLAREWLRSAERETETADVDEMVATIKACELERRRLAVEARDR